jgi:hypothetical protein
MLRWKQDILASIYCNLAAKKILSAALKVVKNITFSKIRQTKNMQRMKNGHFLSDFSQKNCRHLATKEKGLGEAA